MIDTLESKTINILRVLLMVLIVFIHIGINTDNYGPAVWWVYNLIPQTVSRISTQLFFIFSGYLFFIKRTPEQTFTLTKWKQKLIKRFHGLLIPYLLWNAIALLLLFLIEYFGCENHFTWLPKNVADFTLWDYVKAFTAIRANKPVLYPFWFIRNLMLLSLIAPLIYYMVKNCKWFFPVVFILMWLLLSHENRHVHNEITALAFFSFGAYLSVNNISLVYSARKLKYWPLVVWAALSLLCLINGNHWEILKRLASLFGITAALWGVSRLLETGRISDRAASFSEFSFFVYGFHTMFIQYMQSWLQKLIPDNDFTVLLIYFLSVILTIAVAWLLYSLLRRFLPRANAILNGSR